VDVGVLLELEVSEPTRAIQWLRAAGFVDAALYGRRVHVLSRNPGPDLARLPMLLGAGGVQVARIQQRPLSMEDVFVVRVSALEALEAQKWQEAFA
jgi:ABC-2 type transport system ATP-binding protein